MPSSTSQAFRGTDYLLGILTLLLGGLLLFQTAAFLHPVRLPPASPGSYHYIARLDELAPGTALEFDLENHPWLLVRTTAGITAVSKHCTYRGSMVQWDTENSVFLCEGHGCIFGHRGQLLGGLAASPLETLRIRISNGRVYGARDRS